MKYILLLFLSICISLPAVNAQNPPDKDKEEFLVFTKVEVEADFPGGIDGWRKYLMANLDVNKVAKKVNIPKGEQKLMQTVIVKFIVGKDGTISDVKAENDDVNASCIKEAIRVIQISPNWIPARQNGRIVNAYRRQPITFLFER